MTRNGLFYVPIVDPYLTEILRGVPRGLRIAFVDRALTRALKTKSGQRIIEQAHKTISRKREAKQSGKSRPKIPTASTGRGHCSAEPGLR